MDVVDRPIASRVVTGSCRVTTGTSEGSRVGMGSYIGALGRPGISRVGLNENLARVGS